MTRPTDRDEVAAASRNHAGSERIAAESRRQAGPERIAAAFQHAADQRRGALTVFLAAGDPDYQTTVRLARAAVDAGADVIELGSPFSDPLADGPVIQAAYTRALQGGATTAGTLACAARIAEDTGAPVVLMVAFNTVLTSGVGRYCRQAAAAGVCGLLVPDLPVDDAHELRHEAAAAGLATIFLVGPDSAPGRVEAAAAASTGFVYALRRRGTTGTRTGRMADNSAAELRQRVAEARAAGAVPVAVGFGISKAGDVAEIAGIADGVVVGSALVDAAFRAGPGDAVRVVGERVRELATGLGVTRGPLDETPRAAAETGDGA